MMKLLAFSLALLSATPAHAMDCVTAANATVQSECVVLERSGVRGVWFTLTVADDLRRAKLSSGEYQLQIGLLEQRAALRDWQVGLYLEAVALKQEAITELEGGLAAQVALARQAREGERAAIESAAAWYKQPTFWFSIGVGVSFATVIATGLIR